MRSFALLLILALISLLTIAAETWDRAEIYLGSDDQITDQVSTLSYFRSLQIFSILTKLLVVNIGHVGLPLVAGPY